MLLVSTYKHTSRYSNEGASTTDTLRLSSYFAHSVDKNPKRIRAIAALIPSYSRFTELLAYDKVCTQKSNDDISTWNVVHK